MNGTTAPRVHWYKGGNLCCLLSGFDERLGRVRFLGLCGPMRGCLTHWGKAWRLVCAGQYSDHDLVPPSSLEGCSQMHQATDGRFRPKGPRGLEAKIDHPPHRTLDLARADGELARLQGHI